MTMDPLCVWLYCPAALYRTPPWPPPSGLERGDVGGMLLGGRVWCVVLCCTPRCIPVGLVSAGNSAMRLSKVASLAMTLMLGTAGVTVWPCVNREVIPSRRRLFLQSTSRLKWDRKSTPMMGSSTSATMKHHVKSRRSPGFRLLETHP